MILWVENEVILKIKCSLVLPFDCYRLSIAFIRVMTYDRRLSNEINKLLLNAYVSETTNNLVTRQIQPYFSQEQKKNCLRPTLKIQSF